MNWLTSHLVDDARSLKAIFRRYSVRLALCVSTLTGIVLQQQSLIVNLLGQLPTNSWARLPIVLLVMVLVAVIPTLAVLWKQPEAGQ